MMDLVRWNPWKDLAILQNRINRLFGEPFLRSGTSEEDGGLGTWYPDIDMFEQGDKIVITADLPGMDKKDVSVEVKDRVLTLKGERKLENEVKEDDYYRRERSYGRFQRSFTLPAEIDENKIKADFKNGVLKIELPRPEEQKPKQITIH